MSKVIGHGLLVDWSYMRNRGIKGFIIIFINFMKKIFLYYFIFIFLFFATGCTNVDNSSLQKISINNKKIAVEIMDTPELRFQGLSGRESLPEDTGMLFVFDKYVQTSFVMRDMKFSIEIH